MTFWHPIFKREKRNEVTAREAGMLQWQSLVVYEHEHEIPIFHNTKLHDYDI